MPRKRTYITATDQFCGAGGSTSGAKESGVEVLMALNHWKLAIETHNTNHPDTDHDCTDVQACDPRRYPSTDILITSPECTNHSLAKGNKRKNRNQLDIFGGVAIKPEHERSRATMWDVPRFAEYHDYNIVIVENVVDARYWRLWGAWLQAMNDLGYNHKCCYFNSMFFHPCPQSRDRMYVVFWKKGNKQPDLEYRPIGYCSKCGDVECFQSWKKSEKKWGKYKQQYLYRCHQCNKEVTPYYYAAFNAIDWSLSGKRIGDRKKPLADKTIARIKYGLEKYGSQNLVITTRYSSGMDCRVRLAHTQPVPTQTGDPSHNILIPFITSSEYNRKPKTIASEMWTQNTNHSLGLVTPFIAEMNRTGKARSVNSHLSTVLANGNHHLLIGNYSPGWTRTINLPTGTVTTSDSHGLLSVNSVNSFLSYYYGGSNQASHSIEPINTVTTNDRAALVTSNGIKIEDCYYRMLKAHEIQSAMAFKKDYVVLGTVKEKVKQLGNAVTPPVMKWIVKQCVDSLT